VTWTVILVGGARRDLRRLAPPVAARILDALTRLADAGQGNITRLQGSTDEWRLRVGDWRVRFRYDIPTRTLEVLHSPHVGKRTAREGNPAARTRECNQEME
jgi:mRNA interferase RelE/StbE